MEFILNGQPIVATDVSPHTTVLDFLRHRGLTGAKEGCAEGECGACTVVLVKPSASSSEYIPINSCLVFLPSIAGQEVLTVEALSPNGQLSAPQQAILDHGGTQCGYCTPGFVMSLFAEYYRPGRTGPCDPHSMGGNLCRCTGYRPIRDAALSLDTPPDDAFRRRLDQPTPPTKPFSSPQFIRPADLSACLRILADQPDAKLLAGATDLAVESNLRGKRWPLLVAIDALPELRAFDDRPTEVEIGASLTLSEIERLWSGAPPVVSSWFPLFASNLIRNRATLGGNLATASPIGDSAPLLLSLDAELRIAGTSPKSSGERRVPLSDFFTAYRRTALAPTELIRSILIPKPFPSSARFFKIAKRRLDDISTVAASIAIDTNSRGLVTRARLAYGGVAATPVRALAAEQSLEGEPWNEHSIERTQRVLRETLNPIGDHRGSADYRLAMAQRLLEKFFLEQREGVAA